MPKLFIFYTFGPNSSIIPPNWSSWNKLFSLSDKHSLPTPLEILYQNQSKYHHKNLVKKLISKYSFIYFYSQSSIYSPLSYFNLLSLEPNTPNSIIIHSGTSNYLNFKSSVMSSLLSDRYCLNYLKAKFNTISSPFCQMYNRKFREDISHLILYCLYLDSAHQFALLIW